MRRRFKNKSDARTAVWDRLQEERLARFPFPPHGRIPNFSGAEHAAERLFEHELMRTAKRIKVNPDAPQRSVRVLALRHGITLFVPTPRLRGGFKKFDPKNIPESKFAEAASLSGAGRWGEAVALDALPKMDLIVAGSVAVTRDGRRCGKGEGYSDLEFAILRELGHPAVPVVTTVHAVQIVDEFPRDANDLPVSLIVTPDEVIVVKKPPPPPRGLNWALLSEADMEAMPVLEEIRKMVRARRRRR